MQEREITVRVNGREFSFPLTVETDPGTGEVVWSILEWSAQSDDWVELAVGRVWNYPDAVYEATKAAVILGF